MEPGKLSENTVPLSSINESRAVQKFMKGDYNTFGAEFKHAGIFLTPSALARRSYFHLQGLVSIAFPRTHYTKRSAVNSYLLALTFSGAGELQYEGKSYTLEPNEGFIIDCQKPHYYRAVSNQGWGYHIIHFNGYAMQDYFSQIIRGNSIKIKFSTESQFYLYLKQLFEINSSITPKSEMLTSCVLTNMLTEIMQTLPAYDTGEAPQRIGVVRDYIDENFSKEIYLEQMASNFAISKYHLCREFKKYIGQSLNEYLITTRINNAKKFLRFTDLHVSEICDAVGFASANHFFYLFKKHENISPSEYRKQWKNDD
jgi:AraC-like DNA-binding protein